MTCISEHDCLSSIPPLNECWAQRRYDDAPAIVSMDAMLLGCPPISDPISRWARNESCFAYHPIHCESRSLEES